MRIRHRTFSTPQSIANIEAIRAFIEGQGAATGPQLCEAIGISQNQVSEYLRHMAGEGMIRCAVPATLYNKRGTTAAVWEIETDVVRKGEQRQVLVAVARNVGMPRDRLVAALFGEAQQQQGQHA